MSALSNVSRWWTAEGETLAAAVFGAVKTLDNFQSFRRDANLRFARLYGNYELTGFAAWQYSKPKSLENGGARLTLNVIASCVDTASSKISKAKPRPMFLTKEGDWSLQRKAKNLTKYVSGVFDQGNIYTIAQRVFTDGCVFGTGALRVFTEGASIKFERAFPPEIVVDDADGMYGSPRVLHQKRLMSRDVLIDMFPDYAHEIQDAKSPFMGDSSRVGSDLVEVLESWHLPSGALVDDEGEDKETDGLHTICLEAACLFSEEYRKSYFPFVFFKWKPKLLGFWGCGLAEELQGIQLEINKLLRLKQAAMNLVSVPRIFVEKGAQVNVSALGNDIASVITYTGSPPVFHTAPAMHGDVDQTIDGLFKKAYEISGISQLSANSQKPAGLNSGAALREHQDIESERFALVGQDWEDLFMEAAKMVVDISRDLFSSEFKDLHVKVRSRKFIEEIPWKDVDMEDDMYDMAIFPVSMLPSTPAGKLQSVQELVQAGFIGKEQALALLDFPDLEEFVSLQTASLEDTKRIVEGFLEGKEYEPPEPAMNLELALQITQSALLRAKQNDAPEEARDKMRTFLSDLQSLKQAAAPPAGAGGPPSPGGPPPGGPQPLANPAAPPVSDMLPIRGAA